MEREFVAAFSQQNAIDTKRDLRFGVAFLIGFALTQNLLVNEGMPPFLAVWHLWAALTVVFGSAAAINVFVANRRVLEAVSPITWTAAVVIGTRMVAAVSAERREATFGAFMLLLLVNFLLLRQRFQVAAASGLCISVTYLGLTAFSGHASDGRLGQVAMYFALTLFIGATASYSRERAARQLFLTARELEGERLRLKGEIEEAAVIAKALLPDRPPPSDDYTIDVFHRSISEASGDWHALLVAPQSRRLHLVLCDIAGHGVQGAIIASTCRAVLSLLVREHPVWLDADDFVSRYAARLNAVLFEQGAGSHHVTMLGATFDPVRACVRLALAAHPKPVLLNAALEMKPPVVAPSASPLGLAAELELETVELPFGTGDELLAFTDGLPFHTNAHRLNRAHGRQWRKNLTSGRAVFAALWAIEEARSGRLPDDDVSMISIRHN